MSIIQLNLFGEIIDDKANIKVAERKLNAKNSYIETMVSVYRILDKLTNRSYIGVSIDPATRLSTHRKGKASNKLVNKLMNERPEDVQFEIIDEFFDPMYKSNGSECRAVKIEAFLIQVYDSIENGMNTALVFHHDYTDMPYWKEVLTPKLYDIYSVANHELLNTRLLKNLYLKPSIRKNNYPLEKDYKEWACEYLLSLESKGIKIYILSMQLAKIDRSNLFRFIRKNDYGAVSAKRISNLLLKIEEHLGIAHQEFPIEF